MAAPSQNSPVTPLIDGGIVLSEANTVTPLRGEPERMARRRFQNPKPFRRGEWWYLQYRKDEVGVGTPTRRKVWVKLAPASMTLCEAKKIAAEFLRPLNQGLVSIGSATNFGQYVQTTYIPLEMPLLSATTRDRYRGVLDNYLIPVFGTLCLRDLTPHTLQGYFSGMENWPLTLASRDKIRDVLASVLRTATKYQLLVQNPMKEIQLPPGKKGKRTKPHISPEQFDELVNLIPEPYATMVYVAIFTGLRVSELIGLKWHDIGFDSIAIDERYCRGDWSEPKSEASAATIGVDRHVIERIHRLKLLTVEVRAGRAIRKYRIAKSSGADDLVFQSVRDGRPMRDNNILTRFLKPAGRKVGVGFVNWRSLRTSRATWMIEAGANPKDVQGQMRHSRVQTTLDIYAQFVPESQRRASERTRQMAEDRIAAARAAKIQTLGQAVN
jgi:integrase